MTKWNTNALKTLLEGVVQLRDVLMRASLQLVRDRTLSMTHKTQVTSTLPTQFGHGALIMDTSLSISWRFTSVHNDTFQLDAEVAAASLVQHRHKTR